MAPLKKALALFQAKGVHINDHTSAFLKRVIALQHGPCPDPANSVGLYGWARITGVNRPPVLFKAQKSSSPTAKKGNQGKKGRKMARESPAVDAESGTVLQVVEVGYVIHDRLLRPAKVGIAKAGSAATESGDQIDT